MSDIKFPAVLLGGFPMADRVEDFVRVHMRWMVQSDMEAVLQIERDGYEEPWTKEEFRECLGQRNCIGKVAEYRGVVVGFMIYELHRGCILILNLAVAEGMQGRGIARQMIDQLKGSISSRRRSRLVYRMTERDVRGQVVLRSLGFRWTKTLSWQTDDGSDIYQMEYRLDDRTQTPRTGGPRTC